MSERATEFLDRWEIANVEVIPRAKWDETARRLADQCREDAARAGIGGQELDAVVDGDLIDNMIKALGAAEFRQIARDQ